MLISSRLASTGFEPQKSVDHAIAELVDYCDSAADLERPEWLTVSTLKRLGLSEER
jgi:hypothetical protein